MDHSWQDTLEGALSTMRQLGEANRQRPLVEHVPDDLRAQMQRTLDSLQHAGEPIPTPMPAERHSVG